MSTSNYLVVGAVGGIGEALARRLAEAGGRVVVTSRSRDRALTLAEEITAIPEVLDINDQATVAQAAAAASADGGLHGLAYCVGSIPLKPFAKLTPADMREAYELNVIGALTVVQATAEALKLAGGSIVLFSSIAARQGFSNHGAIGPAKAAVEGLTLSLAAELAPRVRVNAIAPSLTRTPLAEPLTANVRMAEGIASLHPIPRLGEPGEIAALAAFLLSRDAGWITGQVFGVDGGRSTLRVGRA
jgi:NAD(P)-dependent dehydrogenase (short-subunit alcohol dehydrogenase family)